MTNPYILSNNDSENVLYNIEKVMDASADHAREITTGDYGNMLASVKSYAIELKEANLEQLIFITNATKISNEFAQSANEVRKDLIETSNDLFNLINVEDIFFVSEAEMDDKIQDTKNSVDEYCLALGQLLFQYQELENISANGSPLIQFNSWLQTLDYSANELATRLRVSLEPEIANIIRSFQGAIHWMKEFNDTIGQTGNRSEDSPKSSDSSGSIKDNIIELLSADKPTDIVKFLLKKNVEAYDEYLNIAPKLTDAEKAKIDKSADVYVDIQYLEHHRESKNYTTGVARDVIIDQYQKQLEDAEIQAANLKKYHAIAPLDFFKETGIQDLDSQYFMAMIQARDLQERLSHLKKEKKEEEDKKEIEAYTIHEPPMAVSGYAGSYINEKDTKAASNKSTIININIDALQKGTININSRTVTESAGRIKDILMQSLVSAVNDSEIIMGD